MKKLIIILGCFFLFLPVLMQAQNEYRIRLKSMDDTQDGKRSYLVQLAAFNQQYFNLGGQNYRLYYDASLLDLDKTASSGLLTTDKYTPLLWKEGFENIDASSVGDLSFDKNLGFINFSIALKDLENGGVLLPEFGAWESIAILTFKVKNSIELNRHQEDLFRWARPTLTTDYATAFVEVTEWVSPTKIIPAIVTEYQDYNLSTQTKSINLIKEISIFPNPFNNLLNIQFESINEVQLQVWNLLGKKLQEETLPKGKQTISTDFSRFPSGLYQIRFIQDNQSITKLVEKID